MYILRTTNDARSGICEILRTKIQNMLDALIIAWFLPISLADGIGFSWFQKIDVEVQSTLNDILL